MLAFLVPSQWNCLGRIGRHDVGKGESLGVAFEILKAMPFPVCFSLPLGCILRCKLSATALAPCLPDCCHALCHDGHTL